MHKVEISQQSIGRLQPNIKSRQRCLVRLNQLLCVGCRPASWSPGQQRLTKTKLVANNPFNTQNANYWIQTRGIFTSSLPGTMVRLCCEHLNNDSICVIHHPGKHYQSTSLSFSLTSSSSISVWRWTSDSPGLRTKQVELTDWMSGITKTFNLAIRCKVFLLLLLSSNDST